MFLQWVVSRCLYLSPLTIQGDSPSRAAIFGGILPSAPGGHRKSCVVTVWNKLCHLRLQHGAGFVKVLAEVPEAQFSAARFGVSPDIRKDDFIYEYHLGPDQSRWETVRPGI